MDDPDPKSAAPAAPVGAKRAFLDNLDAMLASQGLPVRAPSRAPKAPPPPALTFEAWAALSARFAAAPPEDLGAALAPHGVTLEVWKRLDEAYRRTLSDDVRAGHRERPAIYEARYKEARIHHEQALAAQTPPGEPTPEPAPEPAPAYLRGTNAAPDLPSAMVVAMGRMPFMPPAPAPAPTGKRAPKTVESKARPTPVGGETLALDASLQRPTPNLPFVGAPGDAGAVYVPPLDARQYVALRAALMLKAAPREETLRRYHVPNEAALRALDEQWRHPMRRTALEAALTDFWLAMRGEVLR